MMRCCDVHHTPLLLVTIVTTWCNLTGKIEGQYLKATCDCMVLNLLIFCATSSMVYNMSYSVCSLTPSIPVIHDLLHFCKLSAHSIITIERSEVCHWITTLPGFVPYPRNLLLPLAIPLPYKAIDKEQSLAGPTHAPIVLPSNQEQLDSSNQTIDKDHMSTTQLNSPKTEII